MIEESSKPPQMSPASLDTTAELSLKNKKQKHTVSKMDTTPNTGHPELVFAHICLTVNALDSSISETKKNLLWAPSQVMQLDFKNTLPIFFNSWLGSVSENPLDLLR